jgi:hypothetical protein
LKIYIAEYKNYLLPDLFRPLFPAGLGLLLFDLLLLEGFDVLDFVDVDRLLFLESGLSVDALLGLDELYELDLVDFMGLGSVSLNVLWFLECFFGAILEEFTSIL